MGNNADSKMFMDIGKEMVKAAVKVLTEGEGAPGEADKIKGFVSTVLQLPETISEEDLDRAITELDPDDDISTNAERFIRAAAIYVYSQRQGEGQVTDFWLACRECLVKLGLGNATQNMCATPSGDENLHDFCTRLVGCDFMKNVESVGTEFTLWKISKDALKMLEKFLESKVEGAINPTREGEAVAGQSST